MSIFEPDLEARLRAIANPDDGSPEREIIAGIAAGMLAMGTVLAEINEKLDEMDLGNPIDTGAFLRLWNGKLD